MQGRRRDGLLSVSGVFGDEIRSSWFAVEKTKINYLFYECNSTTTYTEGGWLSTSRKNGRTYTSIVWPQSSNNNTM